MTGSIRDSRLQQPDTQDLHESAEARRPAEVDLDNDAEVTKDEGDVSPHDGGRAQPGDVLGIETGGETTEIGDTAEDENERRRDSTTKNG